MRTQPLRERSTSFVPYKQGATRRLGEILQHDELYQAYPQLRNLRITIADMPGSKGMALGNRIFIDVDEIGDSAGMLSTLLHEVQHIVQDVENFDQGGNELLARALFESLNRKQRGELSSAIVALDPRAYESDSRLEGALYQLLTGEAEAFDAQARFALTDEQRRSVAPALMSRAVLRNPKRNFFQEVALAWRVSRMGGNRFNQSAARATPRRETGIRLAPAAQRRREIRVADRGVARAKRQATALLAAAECVAREGFGGVGVVELAGGIGIGAAASIPAGVLLGNAIGPQTPDAWALRIDEIARRTLDLDEHGYLDVPVLNAGRLEFDESVRGGVVNPQELADPPEPSPGFASGQYENGMKVPPAPAGFEDAPQTVEADAQELVAEFDPLIRSLLIDEDEQ